MNRRSRLLRVLALLLPLAACEREAAVAPPPATRDAAPASEAPLARIDAKAAAEVGIVVAQAGPAEIAETLPLYGVVKPDAEAAREVVARFPGTVRSVAKKLGDPVRAGEVLATVESNESLQVYAITAPVGGVITAREADPGEQTGADVLFRINDPARLWVEFGLFPSDLARLRPGLPVRLASVDGGLRATVSLDLVGSFGSATPVARARLADRAQHWVPGLFVNATVELARRAVPVAVRATALQRLDGQAVVFVPAPGGFVPRAVRSGRADAEQVEIVEGLAAGDSYVAAGSFVVKAELGKQRLREEDDDEAPPAPAKNGAAADKPADADDDAPARKAGEGARP